METHPIRQIPKKIHQVFLRTKRQRATIDWQVKATTSFLEVWFLTPRYHMQTHTQYHDSPSSQRHSFTIPSTEWEFYLAFGGLLSLTVFAFTWLFEDNHESRGLGIQFVCVLWLWPARKSSLSSLNSILELHTASSGLFSNTALVWTIIFLLLLGGRIVRIRPWINLSASSK